MSSRSVRVRLLVMFLGLAASVAAQGSGEFTPETSPYQKQFPFAVGEDIRPMVDVEGVRWSRLWVGAKEGKEIEAGKEAPVLVEMTFENVSTSSADLLVILLFEDADHNALDRLELDPFKARDGRVTEERQKLKLDGDVLLAAEGVYVYMEVSR